MWATAISSINFERVSASLCSVKRRAALGHVGGSTLPSVGARISLPSSRLRAQITRHGQNISAACCPSAPRLRSQILGRCSALGYVGGSTRPSRPRVVQCAETKRHIYTVFGVARRQLSVARVVKLLVHDIAQYYAFGVARLAFTHLVRSIWAGV